MELELDKHFLMKRINLLSKLTFIRQTKPQLHHSVSLDVHAIMTLKTFSNQHIMIEHLDHLDSIMVNHKTTTKLFKWTTLNKRVCMTKVRYKTIKAFPETTFCCQRNTFTIRR